jgi:hypothetical protein
VLVSDDGEQIPGTDRRPRPIRRQADGQLNLNLDRGGHAEIPGGRHHNYFV